MAYTLKPSKDSPKMAIILLSNMYLYSSPDHFSSSYVIGYQRNLITEEKKGEVSVLHAFAGHNYTTCKIPFHLIVIVQVERLHCNLPTLTSTISLNGNLHGV